MSWSHLDLLVEVETEGEAHGLSYLDDDLATLHCGMKTGTYAQVSPLVSSWF